MKWSTIIEGESELSSRRRIDVAGRDLTLYLQKLLYTRGYSFTTAGIAMVSSISSRVDLIKRRLQHAVCDRLCTKAVLLPKKNKKEIRKKTLDPCSSFWSRGNILMASQWSWHELMVWRSQYYRYKNMFMLLSDWFDFLKRKYELVKYSSEVHASVYWFGLYVISGLPRI